MICIQNVSLQKPLERATITDLVKKTAFQAFISRLSKVYTTKSKHSEWTQWHEAKCGRLLD